MDVKAAAAYCRISSDRGGEGLGVARQEAILRDLAGRRGWPVAEVYVDNDVSAYAGGPRPAYARMLADLAAGARDAVLVVDTDRLTRRPAELEEFIALADRHGVALANAAGDLDLSSSDGRFRARIMGAVARQESEKKAERLRREREQRAVSGRPHPGPRVFGFRPGNVEHDPDEAALIREAAQAVLSGRSIRSVADTWNAAGVATARGNRWTVSAVRDVLVSPRTAGLREHRGEVVGPAVWAPILERGTWERLTSAAALRRRSAGRPPARALSGVARCGRCGHPMRVTAGNQRSGRAYACKRTPADPAACGRLSVDADGADAEVGARIAAVLAGDALAALLAARTAGTALAGVAERLAADEAALAELVHDHYVERRVPRGAFVAARDDLERRIAAGRARLAAGAAAEPLAGLPADEAALRAWWDAADADGRRAVVLALVERVEVAPLDRSRPRRFDPARLRVVWRA